MGVTYRAWVLWVSQVEVQVRDGGAPTAEETGLEQGVSVTGFLGVREAAQAHMTPTGPRSWIRITHHILTHGCVHLLHRCHV